MLRLIPIIQPTCWEPSPKCIGPMIMPLGYYDRVVKPLTRCRHELKVAEAMGNRAAAKLIKQNVERLEAQLAPEKESRLGDHPGRWDWLLPKTDKPVTKMDTQGL